MVRKTRRRGAGYSKLAKSLMTHRHYDKTVIPQLARELDAAQELNREIGRRAATMRTPEGRAEMEAAQLEHAKETFEAAKKVTDKADAAREAARYELESKGGRRRRKTRRLRKW